MAEARTRRRFLWWVAGADQKILSECPEADQIFVQHLGVSLSIAFFFVLFATSTAVLVAFPNVSALGTAVSLIMAFLVACSVFLIDRLFIQADWDWQAKKQHEELAAAAWEQRSGDGSVANRPGRSNFSRVRGGLARLAVVGGRLALAAAIGFTVASFLELVIYKNEISTEIYNLHYRENQAIYDQIKDRQAQIDADVANARAERDRLQAVAASLQTRMDNVIAAGPATPSATRVAEITAQIADIQKKLDAAGDESDRQQRQMVCEKYGTGLNPNCSGKSGQGNWYATARDLKAQSDAQSREYQAEIAALVTQRQQAQSQVAQELSDAGGSFTGMVASVRAQLDAAASARDAAQKNYDALNGGRDKAVADYVNVLKASPDFKPISFGMASQFRALSALYTSYGIQLEKFMVKFLIMLIELTPVLQKLFLSPRTLYALKLDSDRKLESYEQIEHASAARRQHLSNLDDDTRGDRSDVRCVARLRRDNVRDFATS